jgi:hypothetical protein
MRTYVKSMMTIRGAVEVDATANVSDWTKELRSLYETGVDFDREKLTRSHGVVAALQHSCIAFAIGLLTDKILRDFD